MLKFLGNGSGFTPYHNNCYFVNDKELVFVDLSMLNISKALEIQEEYSDVSVIITHMHDDHVSGIGMFAQYLFYVFKKKLTIIIPKALFSDITEELKIKGVNWHILNIIIIGDEFSFIEKVIPTSHTPELIGKCFGYKLNINNNKIIYTGDTNRLEDFIPYLDDVNEFYVDVSYSYGGVHLKWDDVRDKLFEISNNCDVYLMHMDNIDAFKMLNLQDKNIKLVKRIDE